MKAYTHLGKSKKLPCLCQIHHHYPTKICNRHVCFYMDWKKAAGLHFINHEFMTGGIKNVMLACFDVVVCKCQGNKCGCSWQFLHIL